MMETEPTTATAANKPTQPTHNRLSLDEEDRRGSLVLLNSLQHDAEVKERTIMNLKMEVAHLRERLHMRVGGDTNAIELEAENFTLKKSLAEAQEATVQTQAALRDMDAKYSKAMMNLVKLDRAWQETRAENEQKQLAIENATQQSNEWQQKLQHAQENHLAAIEKLETTLQYQQEQVEDLKSQLETTKSAQEEWETQAKDLKLELTRVQSHLDQLQHTTEQSTMVPKQELQALETKFQASMEENAMLKGEAMALRDQVTSLTTQLQDTRAHGSSLNTRLLQMKETTATLQVHLNAEKKTVEAQQQELQSLSSEIERLQAQLQAKDDQLLTLEREKSSLECEIAQFQKQQEWVEHAQDQQTKRNELHLEKEWKKREFELEKKLEATENDKKRLEDTLVAHEHAQEQVLRLMGASDKTDQDVVVCVTQQIATTKQLAASVAAMEKKLATAEKELARMKQLEIENADVRAQYDKVKKAMERMVQRRTKFVVSKSHEHDTTKDPQDKENESKRKRIEEVDADNTKKPRSQDDDSVQKPTSLKTKRVFVASRYKNY